MILISPLKFSLIFTQFVYNVQQGFLGASHFLEADGKLKPMARKRVGIAGMKAPARAHTEVRCGRCSYTWLHRLILAFCKCRFLLLMESLRLVRSHPEDLVLHLQLPLPWGKSLNSAIARTTNILECYADTSVPIMPVVTPQILTSASEGRTYLLKS